MPRAAVQKRSFRDAPPASVGAARRCRARLPTNAVSGHERTLQKVATGPPGGMYQRVTWETAALSAEAEGLSRRSRCLVLSRYETTMPVVVASAQLAGKPSASCEVDPQYLALVQRSSPDGHVRSARRGAAPHDLAAQPVQLAQVRHVLPTRDHPYRRGRQLHKPSQHPAPGVLLDPHVHNL